MRKPGSPPYRIAHVVFSLGTGGLETGLINLLGQLKKDEFVHKIFCMKALGPNAEKAEALGVEVEQIGTMEGKNRFIIPKLAKAFSRFGAHLVHSRNFGTVDAILAARLARACAVVHGEHGWDTFDPEGRSKKRRFIRGALSPLVDRYICVSKDLERWLLGHSGRFAGKTTAIVNGVDARRFAPKPRSPRPFTVFGTVGRLVPIKDHASLIAAFGRAAAGRHDLRLRIVGDGPEKSSLEALATASAAAPFIAIEGPSSRPEDVYADLDVFCLPSLNEGISNTILEAMAAGLPVVATRVGGNPELIEDGETGILVPKQDPEALAQALRQYADDSDRRLRHGAAARERVLNELTLTRMAERYRAVYRSALRLD